MSMKFAIIESQNPIDIFYGRNESSSLLSSLRMFGNQALILHAKSANDFSVACDYLSSSDGNHCLDGEEANPIFVHISSHGNNQGIALGKDFMDWKAIAENISKIAKNKNYIGKVCLSISSCGSGSNKIHKEIEKNLTSSSRIEYIFSIPGEKIDWDEALVAWILVYYNISQGDLDKSHIQKSLKRTYDGTGVLIKYNRYDNKEEKYLTWSPRDK
ncbi:hypothetical protein HF285_05550 [Acidithiobacillus ferrooxidans F221]|uniref:C13 family peptidase n=1 Tax=Acidithiobacillus ferrooxidans TaxID=920 RepID=UPI001C066E24|nr:hypothetical protein [Acidithiobacillus ferrooxidans]MBU2807745.1 hypothetical protein [Acidithiobacillus ferrooxidans F221]